MAVREVVSRYTMEIDPAREFRAELPSSLLEGDANRERTAHLWKSFTKAVSKINRSKRNIFVERRVRKIAFEAAMFRVCQDFSNRFENIKAEFKVSGHDRYELVLEKLSIVPESCRHVGQQFVAEIPQQHHPEAEAQLVRDCKSRPETEPIQCMVPLEIVDWNEAEEAPCPVAPTQTIPTAPIESMDPPDVREGNVVTTSATTANVPVAVPVEAMTTALQRMEQLESIRPFLSEREYQTKRQAILNSV